MSKNSNNLKVGKTAGWILFAIGIVAAAMVLLNQGIDEGNVSETLGQIVGPILISLVGLYFAGIITKAR